MNPFDLSGPEFLVFYSLFSAAVVLLIVISRRLTEKTDVALPRLSDPYQIAYLRAGNDEAIRVAAASLLDRKLLELTLTGRLATAAAAAIDQVRRPIEHSILSRYKIADDVSTLTTAPGIEAAALGYKKELIELGLLPDEPTEHGHHVVAAVAIMLLVGTALIKIGVALSRGRTNIFFLIVMAVVANVLAYWAATPRRTRAGDALLSNLKELFTGLKMRAHAIVPGGANNELAFLAGVFGLSALPAGTFPFANRIKPVQQSSCGSSSSSSCGSSSSSCGGGGGGGGCGGCGS